MTCQIFLCAPVSRRIEGGSWCKNSVQIFSTLQKKLLNSLLEKTGQVLRECPERGQWPGARASGCGESRNGGRWVPRPSTSTQATLGKEGTQAWGHTYVRLPYQVGSSLAELGLHIAKFGPHIAKLKPKVAKLEQNIVNLEPHIVKLGIFVDWPTQLTVAIWVYQWCPWQIPVRNMKEHSREICYTLPNVV